MRSELDMAFDEEITDNQTIADLMHKAYDSDEILKFLEAVTNNYEHGACPICGEHEVAVDKDGKVIAWGEDLSNATWIESHSEDCIVTYLQTKQGQRAAPFPFQYTCLNCCNSLNEQTCPVCGSNEFVHFTR